MSKAEVKIVESQEVKRSPEDEFVFPHPLNPLDVMFAHQVISYDVVNMPPVSLIQNVRIRGQSYRWERLKLRFPAQMQYQFRS